MTSNEGYHGYQASERLRRVESRERLMSYNADPSGVVTAGATTLLIDYTNWDLYVNDTGGSGIGTSWQLVGGGGGAIPHNLLNGVVHPDTVNSAPVADAMIYADGTPEWDRTTHLQWSETNDVLTLTPQAAGGIVFSGANTFNRIRIPDNIANGLFIDDDNSAAGGSPTYVQITSTDGSQIITFGTEVTDPDPTGGATSERWGNGATATGTDALAVGGSASVTANQSVAMGYNASATDITSVVIGHNATSGASASVVIGKSADGGANNETVVIGTSAIASGADGTAVGWDSAVTGAASAFGHGSVASVAGCIAIGVNAQATSNGAFAFGNNTTASAVRASAFGRGSTSSHSDAYVFGENVTSAQANSFIIGNLSQTVYDVGIGTNAPDVILHAEETTALTNTVNNMFRLTHLTTGTPAASFGTGFEWELESTTSNRIAATDETIWQTATDASRSAIRRFEVLSNTNDWEFLRLAGNSGQAESVFNDGQQDIDFRVESDTLTNALFVQASDGFVGIGAITPGVKLHILESDTLVAGVTDSYIASIRQSPSYTGAFTVTRHNYIDMANAILGGGAAVTDGAVIRFDAAAGTHIAVDAGTTKSTPGTVNAWMKININGTIYYIPAYTSKTA